MCSVKSGLVLRDSIYFPDHNDFGRMLQELRIEDTPDYTTQNFVRIALRAKYNAWWTDPGDWIFDTTEYELPKWFVSKRVQYEKEFREKVVEWVKDHILVDKQIENLSTGVYYVMGCKIKSITGDVIIQQCSHSVIREMCDDAKINALYGGSTIKIMRDHSRIGYMHQGPSVLMMKDHSKIGSMFDRSNVKIMKGCSVILELFNRTKVIYKLEQSRVKEIFDDAKVTLDHSIYGQDRAEMVSQ